MYRLRRSADHQIPLYPHLQTLLLTKSGEIRVTQNVSSNPGLTLVSTGLVVNSSSLTTSLLNK